MEGSTSRVLYCGDENIRGAAGLLCGLMTRQGWPFDHVDGDTDLAADQVDDNVCLIIISDYPAARVNADCQTRIRQAVESGTGLLMIGGWSSYQGRDGSWNATQIADLLPVQIGAVDDRVNFDQATAVTVTSPHPIVADLPWNTRAPAIGGLNRTQARPGAQVLLECVQFDAHADADRGVFFEESGSDVLLAVDDRGPGRTAAFTTDVAPHWIGPLIDWGNERVILPETHGAGSGREVGHLYAQFLMQLLAWARRDD